MLVVGATLLWLDVGNDEGMELVEGDALLGALDGEELTLGGMLGSTLGEEEGSTLTDGPLLGAIEALGLMLDVGSELGISLGYELSRTVSTKEGKELKLGLPPGKGTLGAWLGASLSSAVGSKLGYWLKLGIDDGCWLGKAL